MAQEDRRARERGLTITAIVAMGVVALLLCLVVAGFLAFTFITPWTTSVVVTSGPAHATPVSTP